MVARLDPAPGVRWLDVATGTGAVAIRAAQAGAEVVGIDIAPGMIEGARAKATDLPITFEVGDAQALPYEDASFDVVTSVFGAIFAPDHRATAAELGRVSRGRLGFTSWQPSEELRELYGRFGYDTPEGREPFRWGSEGYVEELLGPYFALSIEPRTWVLEGASGEEIWELWSQAAPPFKARLAEMEEDTREAFHQAYVEYCETYRVGDRVAVPREYLLVLGERR
ncbi:MAG: methyltransferase domain-containing protein [Actinomycetota bacterium]|nr:methyltransferase domain-containing protein [Actinomycetota bacterium]